MLLGLALLSASTLAIYLASDLSRQRAAEQIHRKSTETLAVQAETLSGVLEKYRLLPPLLARQSDIAGLFAEDEPRESRAARARLKAEEIAGLSGAKEVVFFEADGHPLASARDIFIDLPAGRETLVETARQGRLGRAAVSLSSGNRAYAFSSGIRRDGLFIGAVAVYVEFDSIEATWSLSTNPIFVSDESGTVFLTNRPAWRLEKLEDIAERDRETGFFRLRTTAVDHVDVSRDLPLLGWQLHVLGDMRPIETASYTGGLIAGLASLSLALSSFFLLHRRELAVIRNRRDKAVALRLERVIRDRTKALSRTNLSLSHEIDERLLTEKRLKETQVELIQAAKLAGLGQMSATLSHEINQPLAALKTYADNTQKLIEKGRLDQARDNLDRISAMVDRMAELSSALLSFSRKPGTTINPVGLGQVLDEALILVTPRARKAGVKLVLDPALRDVRVLGGRVRLSQVFVNLINNSIDAVENQHNGQIHITLENSGERIAVLVADNGPGIPEDLRPAVFDPFFTTKEIGSGIGIGLSIAYNIIHDFGGRIDLVDRADQGCAFLVTLASASPLMQTAD
ncbi:two-component sensor histidine kinase [Ciceribacter naphthalenivorans]|uniref:C4-dicarboxylate transport sensor protein n=3 Tax=Pseudomonadota TaxID=1224 RepID=A0A512HKY4_9HYPH|nr:two-component sensor histidine kinase [Ciceribacter naphthalenivorans]GLR22683.1 two-component sensor histidine kinase [Ciceribacter naphthalenivorans]GLT05539.1 two-component sensor histidine kinase [Sphingomonas psychrolutea]